MLKYEIKPSIKLVFSTLEGSLNYGDTPLIAVILVDELKYAFQEILAKSKWKKPNLSQYLTKGRKSLNQPIKKLHYDLYLKMIDDKFKLYAESINKEMLHLSAE